MTQAHRYAWYIFSYGLIILLPVTDNIVCRRRAPIGMTATKIYLLSHTRQNRTCRTLHSKNFLI